MQMPSEISRQKLLQAQSETFLAEIEWDRAAAEITLALAGFEKLVLHELTAVRAIVVAYESLDPARKPSELALPHRLALKTQAVIEFEPSDQIVAKLLPLSAAALDDILRASQIDLIENNLDILRLSPLVMNLRIEAWTTEEERVDLNLLVGCENLAVLEEEGEIEVKQEVAENNTATAEPQGDLATYTPLAKSPFALEQGDVSSLPPEILKTLETFFEAQHQNDWDALAAVYPSYDLEPADHRAYLAAHFHEIWDWGFARALDSWWQEGELANVNIRGIHHSPANDEFDETNEECLWSFSLGHNQGRWEVRHFAQSWPSVDASAIAPFDACPWLDEWAD